MKKRKAVLAVLCAVGVLTGCAGRGGNGVLNQESSRIYVTEEGILKTSTVETFAAQEYYKEEELKTELEEVVRSYNEAHGAGAVVLDSCSLKEKSADVVFRYDSGENLKTFAAEYNDTANQVDSISVSAVSAAAAGFQAEGVGFIKTDGKTADLSQVSGKGEYRVIMVEGKNPVTLQTQERIQFVSNNVVIKDHYTVQTAAGKNYIIFK